jgi:hypothetical protein
MQAVPAPQQVRGGAANDDMEVELHTDASLHAQQPQQTFMEPPNSRTSARSKNPPADFTANSGCGCSGGWRGRGRYFTTACTHQYEQLSGCSRPVLYTWRRLR